MGPEPTLLLDFDIRLGVTSFLLKAEGIHTIVDALLQTDQLDQDLWSSLVVQLGNLHLLGSGPVDFSRQVPPDRYTALLDFALRRYSLVTVDLPGTMDDQECETLMRAKRIFWCARRISAHCTWRAAKPAGCRIFAWPIRLRWCSTAWIGVRRCRWTTFSALFNCRFAISCRPTPATFPAPSRRARFSTVPPGWASTSPGSPANSPPDARLPEAQRGAALRRVFLHQRGAGPNLAARTNT
jgi:hypothetical protein